MRNRVIGVVTLTILVLALTATARQTDQESARSLPVAVPHMVLKWDHAAGSLAEVQALRWVAYVARAGKTERVDLTEAVCAAPTGKTPADQWSCELPVRGEWLGASVQVAAIYPPVPLAVPSATRIVGAPAGGS
jgi:hypothetical protein